MAGRKKTLEINELDTLKVITEPTRLGILEAIEEPKSVTEIADVLGVPRTRLYHHVKLLEEHGIIRVASTRKKGALSEKVYEPAADSFVPGPKLMESDDPAERVEAAMAGILDTTREDMRLALLRHWSGDRSGSAREIGLMRLLIRLTDEEADQLCAEFDELVKNYGGRHGDETSSDETRLFAMTWLFYPSSRENA